MKIKWGVAIVDGRGKLGGHVASKNRGGAYLRTKVTPSNPQTSAQVSQRAKLAEFSQGWKALTEDQRNSWMGAVSSYSGTNIFGDVTNPSGNTVYTKVNINIAIAGGTKVTLPPQPIGVEAPVSVDLVATAGTPLVEITLDPTATPAGHALVVEATEQLSAGISNANNKFRIVAVSPTIVAGVADITSDYVAKFGTLTAGKKIFVRVKYIRISTGEVSQYQKSTAIVGA